MRKCVAVLTLLVAGACVPVTPDDGNTDWSVYLGDSGRQHYSPLDQITADNFADLEIVWHWLTVDTHLARSTGAGTTLVAAETLFDLLEQAEPERWAEWDGVRRSLTRPSIRALVATPLMVNGILYTTAGSRRAAVALDAETGEQLWRFHTVPGNPADDPETRHGVRVEDVDQRLQRAHRRVSRPPDDTAGHQPGPERYQNPGTDLGERQLLGHLVAEQIEAGHRNGNRDDPRHLCQVTTRLARQPSLRQEGADLLHVLPDIPFPVRASQEEGGMERRDELGAAILVHAATQP